MKMLGYTIAFFIICVGFIIAQIIFYTINNRLFWRALLPPELRNIIKPNDEIKLDSFMQLEEWVALLLYASFMTLPLIALNAMNLIDIF